MPATLRARACLVAALLSAVGADPEPAVTYARYVIVGAGPAGLQLAHYLDTAGRDYLVLDKAAVPGSFFARFPRFRQLISINKKHTGADGSDFSYRQDWNSLLPEVSTSARAPYFGTTRVPCLTRALSDGRAGRASAVAPGAARACVAADYSSTDPAFTASAVPAALRFTTWSDDYYPHADRLVEYFAAWASPAAPRGAVLPGAPAAARGLRIAYGVHVASVARPPAFNATADGGADGRGAVAAGRARFRLAAADGRVFECTFLVWAGGLQKLNAAEGVNIRDVADSYWTLSTDVARYVNKSVLILGRGNSAFEVASHVMGVTSLVHVVGRDTGRIRLAIETHYPGDVRRIHSNLLESYLLKSQDALLELPQGGWELTRAAPGGPWTVLDRGLRCPVDTHGRPHSRCLLGREYDIVLSCPGWQFDASPFAPDVRPAFAPNGKHPALTPAYEAPGVPGLFFAGTLAHAADYRVSSGGFIHGFRYVIRALHRHLEEEEQAAATAAEAEAEIAVDGAAAEVASPPAAWPRRLTRGLRAAAAALLRRANNAAGPFQMFGGLADVLVLPPLPAAAAVGFAGVGVAAALHDPTSFYDPGAADDPALPQAPPHPAAPGSAAAARRASDAVVDAALRGALFEEVPVSLVPLKARAWAAQAAAALGDAGLLAPAVDGEDTSTGAADGAEYITLTLEFGGAHGPPDAGGGALGGAAGAAAAAAAPPTPTPTRKPVVSEWAADPFALWRANASVWTPEQSRFLHPVLRYYHTGLAPPPAASGAPRAPPPPVLEHHLMEDLNNRWDHPYVHVLSLARFLQDVGARRAVAARALAAEPRPRGANTVEPDGAAAPGAVAPAPTRPVGDAARRRVLAAAWATPRRAVGSHAAALRALMNEPYSTLYYGGAAWGGGEAWFHALSLNASDALFFTGPRVLTTHWLDTAPFPVTPTEAAAHAAARDAIQRGPASHRSALTAAAALSVQPPPMTPAQAAAQARADAVLAHWHLANSAIAPNMPIVAVRARAGLARLHAETFGVADDVPTFKIFDGRGPELRVHNVTHAQVLAEAEAAWAEAGGDGAAEARRAAAGATAGA